MPDRVTATPGQTVGPFFGYALPYPRDHELVPPAHPAAVRLHGTVLDGAGAPVPDALVEVRQADPTGAVPRAEGSLRRNGTVFTGWGRCAVDPAGRYTFTTVEPGTVDRSDVPFFALTVFARGLNNRLFTRAYLPVGGGLGADRLLAALDPQDRATLVAVREPDGSLRFDIRLQGDRETVFLEFSGHHS